MQSPQARGKAFTTCLFQCQSLLQSLHHLKLARKMLWLQKIPKVRAHLACKALATLRMCCKLSSDYAYQCLDEAINDLHLSLREPETLLFEQYQLQTLALKKGKLYGRSQELASIKAVFSRVHSSQKSEACFISGFSG